MQLVTATLLFFRIHALRLLRTKRLLLCALGAVAPAAIAFTILHFPHTPPRPEVFAFPAWFLFLQVVVPVLSLIMGSAVISEEIDDRTITYPFSRPVPRAALLFGRWLATAVFLCSLLAAGAALLELAARTAGDAPAGEFPAGFGGPVIVAGALGGAVYAALFAAIGVFLRHPMIVGLGYCFVVEGLLANVPGTSQELTIQYYLRSYVGGSGMEVWKEIQQEAMAAAWDTQSGALTSLAITLAVALFVGAWGISRRQYVMSA